MPVLFDLDGVLIDSSASVIRCWKRWTSHHRIEQEGLEEIIHGRRGRDIVRLLAPALDPVEEELRTTEWQIGDTSDVTPMPGAIELLESLPRRSWAIVTSGPRAVALARIRKAGLPTPAVLVAAEDVAEGKPKPEGYLLAAQSLGVKPSTCLVVEDAPAGVAAGLAAGMRVAAVTSTFAPEELPDADLYISRLSEVTSIMAHFDGNPS